jgi:hypothetical protein
LLALYVCFTALPWVRLFHPTKWTPESCTR